MDADITKAPYRYVLVRTKLGRNAKAWDVQDAQVPSAAEQAARLELGHCGAAPAALTETGPVRRE